MRSEPLFSGPRAVVRIMTRKWPSWLNDAFATSSMVADSPLMRFRKPSLVLGGCLAFSAFSRSASATPIV